MAENVVTRYDPHFHLGMRVMTLIWCFRGWQVCTGSCKSNYHAITSTTAPHNIMIFLNDFNTTIQFFSL